MFLALHSSEDNTADSDHDNILLLQDKLLIEDFSYDGRGPDAFFWVGTEGSPGSRASTVLPHPFQVRILVKMSLNKEKQLTFFTSSGQVLRLPRPGGAPAGGC